MAALRCWQPLPGSSAKPPWPLHLLSPAGTAHGAQGRMQAGAAGHGAARRAGLGRAAPSSPPCPQPVACPWPLQQGPGKLRCSQATIRRASPKFPPRLLSPAETLLLFGDSPSRWEGTGLCWEVTASLGGAPPWLGGTQPGQAAAPQPTPFLPAASSPLPLCWQGPRFLLQASCAGLGALAAPRHWAGSGAGPARTGARPEATCSRGSVALPLPPPLSRGIWDCRALPAVWLGPPQAP